LDAWLTREEAADLMHVVPGTIIRWHEQGKLKPQYRASERQTGPRAILVYNPRELVHLERAAKRPQPIAEPGELAARAFELFTEGVAKRDVVIRTRRTLAEIEDLYEQWRDAGGADVIIGDAAKAELERCLGAFVTVTDLVDLVGVLANQREVIEIDPGVSERVDRASDAEIGCALVAALDAIGA
jgi:hypothetical protein